MKSFIQKILVCVLCVSLSACATKVTDPNDPRFDVTKLKLEGFYKGKQDLCKALQILFYGKDESYVDYILTEIGEAKKVKNTKKGHYSYLYKGKTWVYSSKNISVHYLQNKKVQKVCGIKTKRG